MSTSGRPGIGDRAEAEKYIELLTGAPATGPAAAVMDWATFPDRKDGGAAARPALRFRDTLDGAWERLNAENAAGAGVYVTVNETDGGGYTAGHVRALRALFIDDDSGRLAAADLTAAGLTPTFVVQSEAGIHAYWCLEAGEDLNDFTPAQTALAVKFGTDAKVKDLPRVLRVPGFYHQKKSGAPRSGEEGEPPFLVFVEDGGNGQRYTVAEINSAFGLANILEAAKAKKPRAPRRAPAATAAVYSPPPVGPIGETGQTSETTALVVRPPGAAEFFERARARKAAPAAPAASGKSIFAAASDVRRGNLPTRAKLAAAYLEKVPPAVQGQGGDDATLKACMVVVRDFALDEDSAFEVLNGPGPRQPDGQPTGVFEPGGWNARCAPPWDESDLRVKIRNAWNHGSGEIGAKCAPLVKPAHVVAGAVGPDGVAGASVVVPAAEVEIGSADDLLDWKPVDAATGKEINIKAPETRAAIIRRQLSEPESLGVLLGVGADASRAAAVGCIDLSLARDVRGDDVVLRGTRSTWKPGESQDVRIVIEDIDNEVTNILTRVGNVRENQLGRDEEDPTAKLFVKDWAAADVRAQLMAVAYGNTFDSVLEFLAALPPWDGVDRFDELLDALKCDAPIALYSQYLQKMMLSAIARVFEPGCKVDTVTILQGQKGGERKSTFFRTLACRDDFFSDAKIDVSNKDTWMFVNHFWIHEWSEMDALRRASSREDMKAFLSRQVDTFRPPYGHSVIKMPRRSIFVGSTNPKEILDSEDANRRFWVIPDVGSRGKVDFRTVTKIRAQLWAQTLAAYVAYVGVKQDCITDADGRIIKPNTWSTLSLDQQADMGWWLTEESEARHQEMVVDFVQENIGAELILKFIDTKETITISEILTMGPEALRANPGDRRAQMNVANILKDAGWIKDRHMEKGDRKSFWRRSDKAAPFKGGPGIGGRSNVFALVSGAKATK